jgi:D-amino-acid oxidase
MEVVVVGCGVSGLSTAVRLLEAGHNVAIWAKDLPPATTSNIAAAIWQPYRAFPMERVNRWGKRTLDVFRGLAELPESGVRMCEALEVYADPAPEPEWLECVRYFRRAMPAELGSDHADGYVFETCVVEMNIYLRHLIDRVTEMGGAILRKEVDSLEAPLSECHVVVNCSGLGARSLAADDGSSRSGAK